jgi:hypothetical protein
MEFGYQGGLLYSQTVVTTEAVQLYVLNKSYVPSFE